MPETSEDRVSHQVEVRALAAGDVVWLDGWGQPVVVEAISDPVGSRRLVDATFLEFGLSPGRQSLELDARLESLTVPVWLHRYTNVTDVAQTAWVRGRRVAVPPGGRIELVDIDRHTRFEGEQWRHERSALRTDRTARRGWQTLRRDPAASTAGAEERQDDRGWESLLGGVSPDPGALGSA